MTSSSIAKSDVQSSSEQGRDRGRSIRRNSIPRIVTIGGGHGQATLLRALRRFQCQITAIVPVTDDGGCSGILRRQYDMPPPGDARRCLTSLARDRKLASVFERRLAMPGTAPRSIGNIVITSEYLASGDMQQAVDRAASMLQCLGRVIPAGKQAATLLARDEEGIMILGETAIAGWNRRPVRVRVMGCEQASAEAIEAVGEADFVLIGPGSFFTSVLACLFTGDLAEAVRGSRARKVFLANLAEEGQQTRGYELADYVSLLQDQMQERSGGRLDGLKVLCSSHTPTERLRQDQVEVFQAALTEPNRSFHSSRRLAEALEALLGLSPGQPPRRHGQEAPRSTKTGTDPLLSRVSEFMQWIGQDSSSGHSSVPAT